MKNKVKIFPGIVITVAGLCSLLGAQTPLEKSYPPPGRMVQAGEHRVHLNCSGNGQPTVMIVGAGYSFDWSLVQGEVAQLTRVCTYDPSGSVWSDPNINPTCEGRIEEIHTMLHNVGLAGPLILVGHSVGAAFARLYAARYPEDVRGMVIGDHAGHYRIANAEGMLRPEEQIIRKLSPLAQDMHRWAASKERGIDARAKNAFYDRCIADASRTTSERPDPLGNKPLIVIANAYLAGSDDYQRVQDGLLALSKNSKALIAPNSGHWIPMEDPDIFAGAIREVVSAARSYFPTIRIVKEPGTTVP